MMAEFLDYAETRGGYDYDRKRRDRLSPEEIEAESNACLVDLGFRDNPERLREVTARC
jgi:hypothetical protein